MKYILTQLKFQESTEVEISFEEFQELKRAKEILSECLTVEERFEFIVSNFLDLEKEVLSLCVDYMVRHESDYEHLFEIRQKCNRRLINLLTTTKLYIDQAEKRLYKLFENIDQERIKEQIGELFNNEFDSFVEYQFMEGIRNHVQHAGLPVHLTNSGASRSETAESFQFEFYLRLYANKAEFEKDSKFKKQTLEKMPDKIDIMYSTRVYVDSFFTIHNKIRALLSDLSQGARNVIQTAINNFQEKSGSPAKFLVAATMKNDELISKIHLLLDWDNVRLKCLDSLEFSNLKKCYVSQKPS